MEHAELSIPGAHVMTPQLRGDARGTFLEWFRSDTMAAATGHHLSLAQANCSISDVGVLRGVHFASVPPGQAKYVTCIAGAVQDVIVDVRVGSPTFGTWEAVRLDAVDRRAVYIAEGLGHAFMALEPASAVVYLCSSPYNPGAEHGITPLDPALGIKWPTGIEPVLSEKDAAAPTLAEAQAAGLLPDAAACTAWYGSLPR